MLDTAPAQPVNGAASTLIPDAAAGASPVHKRFLSNRPRCYETFVRAANEYVANLTADEFDNLYIKPYDHLPGNSTYFEVMYEFLNLLRAMDVPPQGRILEVGSGPGWITEILVGLGFTVDALEPSDAMLRVAGERIAASVQHHHLPKPPRVTFHCATLEECTLPDNHFDAVLFIASLHHIIDEEKGIAQCFRMLRPGGVLGVDEWAWLPGHREMEEKVEKEMARFGTLENPFSIAYLDHLLQKHGFEQVVRYHRINGLYPVQFGDYPLKQMAQHRAETLNTLTALKPLRQGPTTADPNADTLAEIRLLDARLDPATRRARLKVKLTNRGATNWNHRLTEGGYVTVALRQGEPGRAGHREANIRHLLPRTIVPGQEVMLDLCYELPMPFHEAPWFLDLINEQFYWFSMRGTVPAEVKFA